MNTDKIIDICEEIQKTSDLLKHGWINLEDFTYAIKVLLEQLEESQKLQGTTL